MDSQKGEKQKKEHDKTPFFCGELQAKKDIDKHVWYQYQT